VWISSFQPITITIDHREELPIPCTPDIPKPLAVEWSTNYALFSQHLLSAAEKAHLDSGSLKRVFSTIWDGESKYLAILPVEASSTWVKGEPVWVVYFRWEQRGLMSDGYMMHIRYYTVAQKTLKLVTMQTCD
jgi:hypothetical protein